MKKTTHAEKSFVMLTRELLGSKSWRLMSINCKRLLDFLCAEHLSKGGRENGQLKATYDQLQNFGIARRLVHKTISEAEAYGLIRVERGGRKGCVNHISIFTVTFLPIFANERFRTPTDDWRSVTLTEIMEFKETCKTKTALLRGVITVSHPSHTQCH